MVGFFALSKEGSSTGLTETCACQSWAGLEWLPKFPDRNPELSELFGKRTVTGKRQVARGARVPLADHHAVMSRQIAEV